MSTTIKWYLVITTFVAVPCYCLVGCVCVCVCVCVTLSLVYSFSGLVVLHRQLQKFKNKENHADAKTEAYKYTTV